jgi:hypothetical protein
LIVRYPADRVGLPRRHHDDRHRGPAEQLDRPRGQPALGQRLQVRREATTLPRAAEVVEQTQQAEAERRDRREPQALDGTRVGLGAGRGDHRHDGVRCQDHQGDDDAHGGRQQPAAEVLALEHRPAERRRGEDPSSGSGQQAHHERARDHLRPPAPEPWRCPWRPPWRVRIA